MRDDDDDDGAEAREQEYKNARKQARWRRTGEGLRRFRRPKLSGQKNFQTNGFRGSPTVTVMTSWHARKWGRGGEVFYAVAVRCC
mmetsp:Transcript_30104/g.40840  ORF Transcript_30104/g.40840 Transcript_30104/m.40840 type:complete len:85 (+) Transcript_30104:175-429(+)